jgi:pentatricopeptide repeat protein
MSLVIMKRASKYFHTANILVAVVGVASGAGIVAVAGASMTGAGSLLEFARNRPRRNDDIVARVERDLEAALDQTHLTNTQRLLILQMIERADLSAETVIACARDADLLTNRLLEGCQENPDYRSSSARDGFCRVVTPILRALLIDPAVCDALRPVHEQAVAQNLAGIQAEQQRQTAAMLQGIVQIKDLLSTALTDKDTTPDVLSALRGMGNSLPALDATTKRIEAALEIKDSATARASLDQALADAAAIRSSAAAAKYEAERYHGDAADAETRLMLLDAELVWKSGDRIGALHRWNDAHSAADSHDLRSEIEALRSRRFNLTLHLQSDFQDAIKLAQTDGLPIWDEFTYNILIAKAADFARAEELFAEMVAADLKPNEITYSTLIAKATDFARAEELFAEMVAAGLKPNEITYSTLIAKATDFARAEELFAEMVAAGLKPTEFTFNGLIHLAPTHLSAMRVWRKILRAGLPPNKQIVTSLMKSVPSITDAVKLARDFVKAGGEMDPRMFGSMMVKTKEYRYLKPIFDGMRKTGPQPDLFIWQHLILNAPDRETRLNLTREMRSIGLEPDRRMWKQLARHNIFEDNLS